MFQLDISFKQLQLNVFVCVYNVRDTATPKDREVKIRQK